MFNLPRRPATVPCSQIHRFWSAIETKQALRRVLTMRKNKAKPLVYRNACQLISPPSKPPNEHETLGCSSTATAAGVAHYSKYARRPLQYLPPPQLSEVSTFGTELQNRYVGQRGYSRGHVHRVSFETSIKIFEALVNQTKTDWPS